MFYVTNDEKTQRFECRAMDVLRSSIAWDKLIRQMMDEFPESSYATSYDTLKGVMRVTLAKSNNPFGAYWASNVVRRALCRHFPDSLVRKYLDRP